MTTNPPSPIPDTTVTHRVCYADTDAGGIVYHARYIELVEQARNRLMYQADFSFAKLAREHNIALIVRKLGADYRAPALLEDELRMRSRIALCQPSRSVWITDVRRGDTLLVTITIEMVAADLATRQLARHPDALLQALSPFLDGAPDATAPYFSTKARSIT
ncbi:YbgC/FadM family acyl-CoA thioesterase [Ramlibacter sp.]|uniref:YbgC/FadM family acyl-CoA thioesterase n=1 Tax=Ramlibacter sp. TaxID=1917967 RepID=UPI00180E58C9|nr:YbgC/FadM family acyl-CoA thioesterase [Ramlibacter sp.]MBA2672715.1 YbgC/FadM family acyl-CoA thioesterase [Ramlibacter sp.]